VIDLDLGDLPQAQQRAVGDRLRDIDARTHSLSLLRHGSTAR
jgi:hypothetical protein